MQLVPARCTACGAALTLDPAQDRAVCPYCGTSFLVEKAIGGSSPEDLLQAADIFIQLKKYGKGLKILQDLGDRDPGDYRVYWGQIRCLTRDFTLRTAEYPLIVEEMFDDPPAAKIKGTEELLAELRDLYDLTARFGAAALPQLQPVYERYIRDLREDLAAAKQAAAAAGAKAEQRKTALAGEDARYREKVGEIENQCAAETDAAIQPLMGRLKAIGLKSQKCSEDAADRRLGRAALAAAILAGAAAAIRLWPLIGFLSIAAGAAAAFVLTYVFGAVLLLICTVPDRMRRESLAREEKELLERIEAEKRSRREQADRDLQRLKKEHDDLCGRIKQGERA